SPDGTLLTCAGSEGIRLWDSASGRPVHLFGGQADSLTFLVGGKRIATGGEDFVVWNVTDGKEVTRLPLKEGLHRSTLSADGKLLAGVSKDGALRLLDATTGSVLRQLNGHEDQVNERPKGAPPQLGQILSVAFSPDGKALASACFQDPRVFLW